MRSVRVRREILCAAMLIALCGASAEGQGNRVRIVGVMKDVMWGGQLSGKVYLDTLPDRRNLFGLGPLENLAGESLIINGRAYRSMVVADSATKVDETYSMKAPFFAYENIAAWTEVVLPDTVKSMQHLEAFLLRDAESRNHPFLFWISGVVEEARFHIVNLPKGATVRAPADAHQGQRSYLVKDEVVDIVGFFSTQHRGIFTHHDSFIHTHLITSDRREMGHLDEVRIKEATLRIGH